MKNEETLIVQTGETKLVIVKDMLFIGHPDDENEKNEVSFEIVNGELKVNEYQLSKAQLLTLKTYLNGEY